MGPGRWSGLRRRSCSVGSWQTRQVPWAPGWTGFCVRVRVRVRLTLTPSAVGPRLDRVLCFYGVLRFLPHTKTVIKNPRNSTPPQAGCGWLPLALLLADAAMPLALLAACLGC